MEFGKEEHTLHRGPGERANFGRRGQVMRRIAGYSAMLRCSARLLANR